MANDLGAIEIPIVVRDNQLKSAVNTTNRLERELTRLVKAVDSNSVSEERYRQTLIKVGRELKSVTQLTGNQAYGAVVRYTNAKQKQIAATARSQEAVRREAAEQKKAVAEQKRAEQAARENTLALNRMRAAYDGSFAVEQRTIELKRRLRQEIASGTMTVRQAGAELLKYRTYMQQFNLSQMAATKGNNRMGVVVQQTGYQVGDFLVQVQGGTNFLVAFGQQATQLVGVLPLIAPQLGLTTAAAIGLSTALGIGIPLMTAIGAAFMRTRDSAEDTTDALGDLVSELNNYKRFSDLARSSTEDLREEFGDLAEEAQALAGFFQEASVARAIEGLSSSVAPFSEELSEAVDNAEKLAQQIAIYGDAVRGDDNYAAIRRVKEIALETADTFGLLPDQVIALQKELDNVQSSASLEQIRDRSLEALQNLQAMEFAGGTIPPEIARIVQELEKVFAASARATAEVDNTGESAKTLRDNLSDTVNEAIRLRDVLNQVASAGVSMTDRSTVLRAQIAAARAGQNVTGAGVRAETAIELARGGATADQIARVASEAAAAAVEVENLENTLSDLLNPKATSGGGRTAQEISDLQKEVNKLNETAANGLTPFDKYNTALKNLNVLRAAGLSQAAYSMEIERLNDELAKSLPLVDDLSDAFGDFLARGLTDFKSFANSIFKSFQNMLSQMIASAARNRILISLGATGSVAGPASAASNLAQGAGVLGGVGAFTSGIGSGLGVVGSGFMAGGLGGAATATAGAVSGGIGMGGAAGFGTAIGAALPVLAAVALAVSFFRSKTKELDSGLNVTVDNMDVLVESFKTVEKSRFWGLSKRVTSTLEEASSTISDPIVSAVGQIQQSVLEAAEALGFGADVFDKFSYQFKLSLKGLSEDQQMQKINEELTKMGDSFASLTGIFSTMDELLAVAQQRFELEGRLLEVQGDVVELRKRELDTVHVLNKGLATRIQLLQAEADLQGSLGAFASAISQQQGLIRSAVDALVKPLQDAIERTKTQAEKSYAIFRAAADKTRGEAQNIVDIITGALSSRNIQSEAVELLRYRQSQQQLASFAGGASFDESSLRRATEGVSIDSTKFFGSFEDYARDFYKTQISLTKLADKAQGELTDVEKQIDIADKAYQVALGTYTEAQDFNTALDQLLTDLAVYTETAARNQPFIDQIKAEGDRQVELLEQILIETTKQVNGLLGIENSVADLVGTNVSVGEALAILGLEGKDLAGAVIALQPVVDAVGSHIATLDLTLSGAIDRLGLSLEDLITLDLTTGFENLNLFAALADLDFGEQLSPVVDIVNSLKDLDLSGPIADQLALLSQLDLSGPIADQLALLSQLDLSGPIADQLALLSQLDLSGPIADQLALLSDLNLTGAMEGVLEGLGGKFSALDLTTAGLNVGLVGLDGTIGILQSSVNSQAEAVLQLDSTIINQSVVVDALSGQVTALSSNVVNLDGTVFGLGTNVVGLGTNISDLGMNTNSLGININDLGATLSNAMSGLGSIVSGLSGAVSGLAASNNALASAQKSAAEAQVNAAVAQISSPLRGNIQSKLDAEAALIAAQEAFSSTSATKTETYKTGGFLGFFKKTKTRTVENPVYNQLQADIEKLSSTIAQEEAILAPAREQIKALGVTPTFATGGMHSGGMRLVGEQGPELEVTGPSRIYSAQQTKSMISGDSSETVAELRGLRQELSEFKAEQRKIGVENVKYNKKSYDLNREWDIVGLPATRTA